MSDEQTDDTTTAKRGRGPAKPKPSKRRSYATELEALTESHNRLKVEVGLAVELLSEAVQEPSSSVAPALIRYALRRLKGEAV